MRKLLLILLVLPINLVFSQNQGELNGVETEDKGINIKDFVHMSGNWFITYRDGVRQTQADDDFINPSVLRKEESSFVLKRSYITLKKDLNQIFSVRYTMDLTVDKEGNDAGNVETRLKYLYVKVKPNIKSETFKQTWIEAGMVHRPWLDYEQKINTYRVQDNMFIERNGIFNSADAGVTVGGNIGPSIDDEFLENVNGSMTGKWVSYVFGLYNGGGYSGLEKNNNKVFAMRISTRPFANTIPEVQVSGYFNLGKGNTEASPDFDQVLGFLAYTGQYLTLTGQYHTGTGDFRAKYVDVDQPSLALKNSGYSFFGEYRLKESPFAVWGRYDYFNVEDSQIFNDTKRIIGGITYRISKNLRLVLNAEHNTENNDKNDIYELNLEVSF